MFEFSDFQEGKKRFSLFLAVQKWSRLTVTQRSVINHQPSWSSISPFDDIILISPLFGNLCW
jgi:hypothetical protein